MAEKLVAMKMTPYVGDPVYERRLRVAQTQVSAWEKGLYQPSLVSARLLALIFGVSVDWLLTGKMSAELQQSTLPLLEPFPFLDDIREFNRPYFSKDFLENWLPVNVPNKIKKADFLMRAPCNRLSFDGIWEGDYVAVHQFEGPEERDGGYVEEWIDVGSRKIFLVLVWKNGKPQIYTLARTSEIEGTYDLMLTFSSSQYPPLAFPKSGGYITAIIGEVRGWIHFENPEKQQPAIFNASSLAKMGGPEASLDTP